MKILIVDDEVLARERLQAMIAELRPDAGIGQAENGLRALEWIQNTPPDVVLLDIRMPVMTGLEAAQHIAKLETPPAIIFTTAYQEHALSAFQLNAIDYLLKPIRRERLQTALGKAALLSRARIAGLKRSLNDDGKRTHLSAFSQGRMQLIPIGDIYYLKAEQKYVSVVFPAGELLIDESLKSLENEFPGVFIRVHRNALVAVRRIHQLRLSAGGGYEICLHGMAARIRVSRRHLAELRQRLKTMSR